MKLEKSGDAVVDSILSTISPFFRRGVIEIQAVRPGEMWLEIEGKGFVAERSPGLTREYWERLCGALANWKSSRYDPVDKPLVSCQLPGGHRFEGFVGVGPETGVSVSIRVFRGLDRTLADFGLNSELAAMVTQAVATGENILVGGGTSSGKTSLINVLLGTVPSNERVCSLEDTPELRLERFPNHVRLIVNRHGQSRVGVADYVDHFMRARPDRIIFGELSVRNAVSALVLLSTGHKGFKTTLHTSGCYAALRSAFPDRLRLAGVQVQPEVVFDFLVREVGLVLHAEKTPAGRRVVEFWRPKDMQAPERLYAKPLEGINVE